MTQRERSQSIGVLMIVVFLAVLLWVLTGVVWPVPLVYTDDPIIVVTKSTNPTSVDEPGGTVAFTARVDNTSVEMVTLTSFVDDLNGDLDGQGTCSVPQTIAIGGFYTCAFTATVSGNARDVVTDTVTAQTQDDEGNPATDSDTATVSIYDVLPTIVVAKTPDPTHVPEPSGTVTFTVRVDNTSVETVTLTSLEDNIHGDLDGRGTCAVTQTIAATGFYQCAFTATVSGNADDSETDRAMATVEDDEGHTATDSDTATVDVDDVWPNIAVTKSANPTSVDEPGGTVTFTVRVDNTSVETVTLTSLVDNLHGDLDGQGTCSVPQTIATGDFYTCVFTVTIAGNAYDSETDTVTAQAKDDEGHTASGSDNVTVDVDDVWPSIVVAKSANPTSVDEPDGTVAFTVRVDNTSIETVTLTSLVDNLHGDLDGQDTCSVPQTIAIGDFYTCAFTATVSGNARDVVTDTVTAQAQDDEGNPATDSDTATVSIDDVSPDISVIKIPNPTHVPEPSGTVTFTVQVENTSVETVTLTSLEDNLHGDLDGQGTCAVTQTIATDGFYICTFTATVSGNAYDSETDKVTATAVDDEGHTATDSDTATVDIDDAWPSIAVTKSANPASMDEPGGTVTFTVRVDKTSVETVTLTSLVDNLHGDLDGQGTCSVPQTIAIGDFYTCAFTATVSGNEGDVVTDTVTAQVQDDENNTASDDGDAVVTIATKDKVFLPIIMQGYCGCGPDNYEPNSPCDRAWGCLIPNRTYQSYISCCDAAFGKNGEGGRGHDYFFFEMTTTRHITIVLDNTLASKDYDLYLYRHPDCKNWIREAPNHNSVVETISVSLNPGIYYVLVFSPFGQYSTSPYSLRVIYD